MSVNVCSDLMKTVCVVMAVKVVIVGASADEEEGEKGKTRCQAATQQTKSKWQVLYTGQVLRDEEGASWHVQTRRCHGQSQHLPWMPLLPSKPVARPLSTAREALWAL